MPEFLKLEPGLVIWTLINFSIFVFIIARFGWKPMKAGLAAREKAIGDSISSAERANAEAQSILREAKEQIHGAQSEVMNIVREGKAQAEAMVKKAADEADVVKMQKLAEAQREIDRQKDEAIKQLRAEVANLVVDTTEKLLGRTVEAADHKRLAEEYMKDLSKN
ncbi:MAG: F0F1 ATP synthase subunit B [Bradyrhizobiaceae bacterium]|nr:F0F1 ATP synthase subunit B [Bradyrhizobiaceae bacterium]